MLLTVHFSILKTFILILCLIFSFAKENVYGDDEIGEAKTTEIQRPQLFFPVTVSLGHKEGRWLGNAEGYTSVELFASKLRFYSDTPYLPFLNLTVSYLNDGRFASNMGGGIRLFNNKLQRIYGINVFYDTYEGNFRYYHQLGIGFELLNPLFDIRFNGYAKIGNSTGHSRLCVYDDFVGGFFATSRRRQSSMQGFELEFGKWITRNAYRFFHVYGSITPYFFASSRHGRHNAIGGQACLLAYMTPYVSCEVKAGYDRFFKGSVQGTIKITIPFPWKQEESNYDMLYQPVRRQKLIVLDHKQCCWTFNWNDNL